MIITGSKITAEKGDTISVEAVKEWQESYKALGIAVENTRLVTVKKVTKTEGGEVSIGPDTAAKSWRNIQEFETADTMTIEILEG